MPRIIPIGHNVLGKAYPKDDVTEGGIVIPATATHQTMGKVKVLAVGDKVTVCKKGDIVMVPVTAPLDNVGENRDDRVVLFSQNIIAALWTPDLAS